ncbi:MAG TPA: methyltransferase domain-containing protein [Gaiellaceae bacterium]
MSEPQFQFDADAAKRIEALYHIRDAVHRRELVRKALGAVGGDRILDVGCGPGFYCLELSEIVGSSGSVVGVDSSLAMLQLARARCASRDNVGLIEGEATALPVESGTFDGAICVQVLEYVSDVDAAVAELHRALRPGGRAVVWDVDWATVSIHSLDSTLTTRVLRAWDEHLAVPSLPRTLGAHLRSAGFEDVRMEAHAFAASGRDPQRYGAALIPFIAAFVAGRQGIGEVEAEAWGEEQHKLMERDEFYFASTQLCFTATKSA